MSFGNVMKMFTITDSRGKESITLLFVSLSWLAVWVKFILAGATLPVFGTVPPMTATEFGMSAAAILAIWLGREWAEKKGG
jgi:hypothetical protein